MSTLVYLQNSQNVMFLAKKLYYKFPLKCEFKTFKEQFDKSAFLHIFKWCLYQLTLILYKMNRKWSLIICLHCGLDLIGLDQQDCRGATQFMKSTRNIRRRRWMSSGLWNGVTWISDGNEWNLQQCNGAKAIFLYYDKIWDGKKYPLVNVKTDCHLTW